MVEAEPDRGKDLNLNESSKKNRVQVPLWPTLGNPAKIEKLERLIVSVFHGFPGEENKTRHCFVQLGISAIALLRLKDYVYA